MKVFLTSGGSDAVDTAAKLARRYWHAVGKPEKLVLIGRRYAYHGMHAWGTSLGGIAANAEGLGPLVADVVHVDASSVDALADAIERVGREHVAAFIGEPVVGAGGVIPPPEGYWSAVAELCREQDVLLIADEVITGFGRLGRWFGCERFGFTPDLLVFAKGVTSGYMPLGGVLVGPRVQEPFWSGGASGSRTATRTPATRPPARARREPRHPRARAPRRARRRARAHAGRAGALTRRAPARRRDAGDRPPRSRRARRGRARARSRSSSIAPSCSRGSAAC